MEFRILGPLEVRADGGAVALGGAMQRGLLAVLLLHANTPVSAERLAVALWGENASAGAVKTVQVHVSRLRKALGAADLIVSAPAGYRICVRPGELDADRFECRVAEARQALAEGRAERAASVLREALALWRGPPLAELVSLPFAPEAIARLDEQRLTAVEAWVEAELVGGRHAELVAELQQLTGQHPWRERLHAQLMLALYRSGRQAEALEAYRRARGALVEQLGIEPGTDLRELEQAILVHDPDIAAPRSTVTRARDGPGGLPVPPTTLFGREADLDAVARLVRQLPTRLVTLVGLGGVGKTRLAIEAARRLTQDFTAGARFVSLAPVSQPRDLASAIARTLAAPVSEGEPAATAVLRFLADAHLLLVLDNFEHLTAGAALIGELLAACPDLTVLVTSREPTRLAAERLYWVRPLEVPAAAGPMSTALEHYGAVAMFCDRARARDPEFALDEANGPPVQEICRRLDGLPLALELAAARIGLLSPGELAARLDRALPLLAGGARDAPQRQRTLRATIDWSYELLTDQERRAFAQLAVFAGGATVAAAETVTGAALDTLDSLVAKQLLARRDDRLYMLETVREYALERLSEDPGLDPVQDRLATWCLGFVREAAPHLVRADRRVWLGRLDAELPNLLAALSWALDRRRAELALQLVGELGYYWRHTNRWDDGLPWIDAALELAPGASPHARATALLARARVTLPRDHQAGQEHRRALEASLELFRACGDAVGMSACLAHMVPIEAIGNPERARALSDEAIRCAERSGDEWAVVFALAFDLFAATGYDDAARRAHTAVPRARRFGDLKGVALMCMNTAYLAIGERRYRDALAWLDQALPAARQLGDPAPILWIGCSQGLARLFLDDLDEAEEAYSETLALWPEVAWNELLGEHLLGLAAVAARRGDSGRAARLAGAAERHQSLFRNRSEDAIWSRLHNDLLAPARERWGPPEWDNTAREGASLTAGEAIDLALARGRYTPAASTPSRT